MTFAITRTLRHPNEDKSSLSVTFQSILINTNDNTNADISNEYKFYYVLIRHVSNEHKSFIF